LTINATASDLHAHRLAALRFSEFDQLYADHAAVSHPDHTDPAVKFNDGLYEGFNTAGGSVMSAYGNLFAGQQTFT
jgi:hypothetical protein